jgi:1-acyl-sn-glycerol-3-phosphate acyltransferase
MKYLYRTYQLCIALPLIAVDTVLTALMTIVGCAVGNGHFWGYFPGKWWSWFICRILLIPVRVSGRENLEKGKSYVFVSNHQGAFDIFLIYGFLRRNFKWMMKKSLRKVPFVGRSCESAHHIFVDKSGPSKIKETYDQARDTLRSGMSLVVFPEGSRTFTGHMGVFRKGAFALADELQLPIVPMTINGSFDILPRTKGVSFVNRHRLTLTIHKPIYPQGKGIVDIKETMNDSYQAIMSGLERNYQGFVENDDQ